MVGEFMLYDWRVYVVCLASICCMFDEYMLYVWRVYVVCLMSICCMEGGLHFAPS